MRTFSRFLDLGHEHGVPILPVYDSGADAAELMAETAAIHGCEQRADWNEPPRRCITSSKDISSSVWKLSCHRKFALKSWIPGYIFYRKWCFESLLPLPCTQGRGLG